VVYWLKSVYNTPQRTSAAEFRAGLSWISDHHRLKGSRPSHRPTYAVGDEIVLYSVTDGACPARLRVTKEAVFDPARVSREGRRGDGKRWGWLTETQVIAAADLDAAPGLRRLRVEPSSVGQKDHIRLTDEQYRLATRELPPGRPRPRRRGPPEVPVEERHVESFEQRFERQVKAAQREEQRLVRDYKAYLETSGRTVYRHRIPNPDGAGSLYEDLFEEDRRNLIEAKSRITRPGIRMAIGQLADYARLIGTTPRRRAVLLPERPSKDLEELLKSQNIGVVWAERGSYADNSRGAFL
jgi:hypothetical protein